MFQLTQKFPSGTKIFSIPLAWFRKVTAFLNNICAGTGITLTQPSEPSSTAPVKISIDRAWLKALIEGYGFVKASEISLSNLPYVPKTATFKTTTAEGTTIDQSATRYDGTSISGVTDHTAGLEFETDTWEANKKGEAFTIPIFTRIFWNASYTSSGSIYSFALWRELTINPNGTIKSVSEEKGLIQIRHA